MRVRSPAAVERDVTLSYITNNFDWQSNYIAELSPAGDRVSLFAWLTLGDERHVVSTRVAGVERHRRGAFTADSNDLC